MVRQKAAGESSDFVLRIRWAISLDEPHQAALRGLLCGLSMEDAAISAGVTDRTLRRWLDAWSQQTQLPPAMLTTAYAFMFRDALAEDESLTVQQRSLFRQMAKKQREMPVMQTPGRSEEDRTKRSQAGRALLNPLLWAEILKLQADLRYGFEALVDGAAEYLRIASALRLPLGNHEANSQRRSVVNAKTYGNQIKANSTLYLPIALALRYLGTPLTEGPTEIERDYEQDFGHAQIQRWARERQLTPDFEKSYDRAYESMLWLTYSYDIRHKMIPVLPAGTAQSKVFQLSPVAGMLCALFCDSTRTWLNIERAEDWQIHEIGVITARRQFLKQNRIDLKAMLASLDPT